MIDLHAAILKYHDERVRLRPDEQLKLKEYRDLNTGRLASGLAKLAEEGKQKCGPMVDSATMGSYAMHTLIWDEDFDYDIDVAVVFNAAQIPESPLSARKRVEEAMVKVGGQFTKKPEARTNAVTVWYQEGYHVDLVVYRRIVDVKASGGFRYEHGGVSWLDADPWETPRWFKEAVRAKSPDTGRARSGQLRRVVRLLKWFCRSRKSWSLPGGFLLSALVAESFRADPDGDDRALHATMAAINERLKGSTDVANPVRSEEWLTSTSKRLNQVKRLRKRLKKALTKLAVLYDDSCTEEQALKAWGYVFNDGAWLASLSKSRQAHVDDRLLRTTGQPPVTLVIGVAEKEGGDVHSYYADERYALPKGVHLRFEAHMGTPGEYSFKWIVENSGDECEAASDPGHTTMGGSVRWEHTAYKGRHSMTCEVYRSGSLVSSAQVWVLVGR